MFVNLEGEFPVLLVEVKSRKKGDKPRWGEN